MRVVLALGVLLVILAGGWSWLENDRPVRVATQGAVESAQATPVELTEPALVSSSSRSADVVAPVGLPTAVEPPLAPSAVSLGTRGVLIVHGCVLDELGAPIEDDTPTVALVDGRGEAREVATDERGVFSFPGLVPGTWILQVDAVGFRTHREEFMLDASNAPLALEIRLERLPRLVVRVVTPRGEPLTQALRGEPGFGLLRHQLTARAVLAATPAPEAAPGAGSLSWSLAVHCATSPSSDCLANHLEFSSFWPALGAAARDLGLDALGVLYLHRDPPILVELVRGTAVLAREYVRPGAREVHFEIDPDGLRKQAAGLTLRALEFGTHEPLTGQVTLLRAHGDPLELPLDAQGYLRAEGLPAGPHELRIVTADHEILRRVIVLPAGDTLALGEILLSTAVQLGLEVVDPAGTPYSGRFALAPLEPPGPFFTDELASSADGRLVFGGLRSGRYLLRTTDEVTESASGNWALAPTEIRVTATGTSPERLELERAAELVLLGTRDLPWRTSVAISRGSVPLFDATLVPGWLPRFRLAPGGHGLEILDANGRSLASHEIELQAGTNELNLAR